MPAALRYCAKAIDAANKSTPGRVTSFKFHDGIDQFFGRSLRTRPTSALGRKQHAVLSFGQNVMKMQQRRWL